MAADLEQLLAPGDLIPAGVLVPARRLISAMDLVPANPPLPAVAWSRPVNWFPLSCFCAMRGPTCSDDRVTPASGPVQGWPRSAVGA
jgi:hypothetical protein